MSVGVLFPGQGSQHVGMGAPLFESRPDLLGDRADEVLGFSLRRLCLEGPAEELTRTEHAQPALFAISYALWEELDADGSLPVAGAAGHSLGEYTALAAAGVLDFDTALRVVARRGRAMAAAADAEPSGMAALIGADEPAAEEVCARNRAAGGRLQLANINAPGQIVVAGGEDDLEWLARHGAELGIRRVIPLNVAGAFHSSFMESAASEVFDAVGEATPGPARFPVWANTTSTPHTPAEVREVLTRQVVEPVRFSACLQAMAAAGIDTFIHVGPGDVTAGLVRRTLPDATVHVVSDSNGAGPVRDVIVTMNPAERR